MCRLDGMIFKTQEELDKHLQAIQQAQQQAQNSMMMYGGLGMMGMGLMGMGMMGGLWI